MSVFIWITPVLAVCALLFAASKAAFVNKADPGDARMQEIAPACEIDTSVVDPTTGTWRITGYIRVSLPLHSDLDFEQEVLAPRYYLLQEQFGYKDSDFSFAGNDPLY